MTRHRPPEPLQILTAARAGSREARAALLERYGGLVFALCRRLSDDPEDAYQEVWMHVLTRLDRFAPDGRASFATWLSTVVRHRLADRNKARRRRGPVMAPDDEAVAQGPSPEEQVHTRRELDRLQEALDRLPEPQRRAVLGHHRDGRELARIAEDEGVKLGTIKSRLHRARAAIVRWLEGE